MSQVYQGAGATQGQNLQPDTPPEKDKDISKRYYQKYSSLTDKQKERAGSREEFAAKKQELGLKGVNVESDTKTRMAGDALNQMRSREKAGVTNPKKYNQGTVDQMNQQVYGVENINDFDATASGAGSGKNTNRLSKADIKGLRKEGGFSKKEILQYVEDNPDVDASGAKAQKLLGKYTDRIANKQKGEEEPSMTQPGEQPVRDEQPSTPPVTAEPTPTPESPTPTPTAPTPEATTPAPTSSTATGGQTGGTMNIGDFSGKVGGDLTYDNSTTNYGGSSRVFNYTPSGNPATDTPVSSATMGGMYDVDDSPAANNARLDRQSKQLQDSQKYWQKDAATIAQDTINLALANTSINPDAIDKRLVNSEQDSFDRAYQMGANIFGDMSANGGAPTFKPPKAPKPVEEPDFEAYGQKIIDGF